MTRVITGSRLKGSAIPQDISHGGAARGRSNELLNGSQSAKHSATDKQNNNREIQRRTGQQKSYS
jgi:hypothetical protein